MTADAPPHPQPAADPAGGAPVIAIDGPSASGKGAVAALVAPALGFHYLDSGALYRAVALAALENGIGPDDEAALRRMIPGVSLSFKDDAILLGGRDVSEAIRSEQVSTASSQVAAVPAVRAALLDLQRSLRRPPGLVAEGRDMASVVFPDAQLKVFLTASPEVRAQRRHKQLMEKGFSANLHDLLRDLRERDKRDQSRLLAPLEKAPGARELDTSNMSLEEAVSTVVAWYREQARA
jgi:cytidylate kinase